MIARMGGLAERQVADATQCAGARATPTSPPRWCSATPRSTRWSARWRAFCIRLLALRQPMGQDLRLIVAALKVGHDLERIGDYARNAAKRSIVVA